jgi:polyhydroxybutyrate depolymerase
VAPYRAWRAVAEANNLLLLVPQGIEGPNGHAGWNDCRSDAVGNPDTDDVGFLKAALTELSGTHRVDRDRISAVGTSNGGHMAIRLAQEAPEVMDGITVIAAGMPANSSCADSGVPVSAVFMWGTVALYRIIGGGHTEPSVEHRYRRLFRAVVGEQNHDIEMADEVWSFLDG